LRLGINKIKRGHELWLLSMLPLKGMSLNNIGASYSDVCRISCLNGGTLNYLSNMVETFENQRNGK